MAEIETGQLEKTRYVMHFLSLPLKYFESYVEERRLGWLHKVDNRVVGEVDLL